MFSHNMLLILAFTFESVSHALYHTNKESIGGTNYVAHRPKHTVFVNSKNINSTALHRDTKSKIYPELVNRRESLSSHQPDIRKLFGNILPKYSTLYRMQKYSTNLQSQSKMSEAAFTRQKHPLSVAVRTGAIGNLQTHTVLPSKQGWWNNYLSKYRTMKDSVKAVDRSSDNNNNAVNQHVQSNLIVTPKHEQSNKTSPVQLKAFSKTPLKRQGVRYPEPKAFDFQDHMNYHQNEHTSFKHKEVFEARKSGAKSGDDTSAIGIINVESDGASVQPIRYFVSSKKPDNYLSVGEPKMILSDHKPKTYWWTQESVPKVTKSSKVPIQKIVKIDTHSHGRAQSVGNAKMFAKHKNKQNLQNRASGELLQSLQDRKQRHKDTTQQGHTYQNLLNGFFKHVKNITHNSTFWNKAVAFVKNETKGLKRSEQKGFWNSALTFLKCKKDGVACPNTVKYKTMTASRKDVLFRRLADLAFDAGRGNVRGYEQAEMSHRWNPLAQIESYTKNPFQIVSPPINGMPQVVQDFTPPMENRQPQQQSRDVLVGRVIPISTENLLPNDNNEDDSMEDTQNKKVTKMQHLQAHRKKRLQMSNWKKFGHKVAVGNSFSPKNNQGEREILVGKIVSINSNAAMNQQRVSNFLDMNPLANSNNQEGTGATRLNGLANSKAKSGWYGGNSNGALGLNGLGSNPSPNSNSNGYLNNPEGIGRFQDDTSSYNGNSIADSNVNVNSNDANEPGNSNNQGGIGDLNGRYGTGALGVNSLANSNGIGNSNDVGESGNSNGQGGIGDLNGRYGTSALGVNSLANSNGIGNSNALGEPGNSNGQGGIGDLIARYGKGALGKSYLTNSNGIGNSNDVGESGNSNGHGGIGDLNDRYGTGTLGVNSLANSNEMVNSNDVGEPGNANGVGGVNQVLLNSFANANPTVNFNGIDGSGGLNGGNNAGLNPFKNSNPNRNSGVLDGTPLASLSSNKGAVPLSGTPGSDDNTGEEVEDPAKTNEHVFFGTGKVNPVNHPEILNPMQEGLESLLPALKQLMNPHQRNRLQARQEQPLNSKMGFNSPFLQSDPQSNGLNSESFPSIPYGPDTGHTADALGPLQQEYSEPNYHVYPEDVNIIHHYVNEPIHHYIQRPLAQQSKAAPKNGTLSQAAYGEIGSGCSGPLVHISHCPCHGHHNSGGEHHKRNNVPSTDNCPCYNQTGASTRGNATVPCTGDSYNTTSATSEMNNMNQFHEKFGNTVPSTGPNFEAEHLINHGYGPHEGNVAYEKQSFVNAGYEPQKVNIKPNGIPPYLSTGFDAPNEDGFIPDVPMVEHNNDKSSYDKAVDVLQSVQNMDSDHSNESVQSATTGAKTADENIISDSKKKGILHISPDHKGQDNSDDQPAQHLTPVPPTTSEAAARAITASATTTITSPATTTAYTTTTTTAVPTTAVPTTTLSTTISGQTPKVDAELTKDEVQGLLSNTTLEMSSLIDRLSDTSKEVKYSMDEKVHVGEPKFFPGSDDDRTEDQLSQKPVVLKSKHIVGENETSASTESGSNDEKYGKNTTTQKNEVTNTNKQVELSANKAKNTSNVEHPLLDDLNLDSDKINKQYPGAQHGVSFIPTTTPKPEESDTTSSHDSSVNSVLPSVKSIPSKTEETKESSGTQTRALTDVTSSSVQDLTSTENKEVNKQQVNGVKESATSGILTHKGVAELLHHFAHLKDKLVKLIKVKEGERRTPSDKSEQAFAQIGSPDASKFYANNNGGLQPLEVADEVPVNNGMVKSQDFVGYRKSLEKKVEKRKKVKGDKEDKKLPVSDTSGVKTKKGKHGNTKAMKTHKKDNLKNVMAKNKEKADSEISGDSDDSDNSSGMQDEEITKEEEHKRKSHGKKNEKWHDKKPTSTGKLPSLKSSNLTAFVRDNNAVTDENIVASTNSANDTESKPIRKGFIKDAEVMVNDPSSNKNKTGNMTIEVNLLNQERSEDAFRDIGVSPIRYANNGGGDDSEADKKSLSDDANDGSSKAKEDVKSEKNIPETITGDDTEKRGLKNILNEIGKLL